MLFSRSTLLRACWLAVVLMALNALWPLIANARPASAAAYTEICTAGGMQRVPVDGGGTRAPELSLTQHCASCAFGGDRAEAPPAAPVLSVSVPAQGAIQPVAEPASGRAFSGYPCAPPRAPPGFV